MKPHFLQSEAWARFQEAMGRPVLRAEGEGWSWQGLIVAGKGMAFLVVPYGPTLEAKGRMAEVLASWRRAGGLDFVRCEPVGSVTRAELEKLGLRQVTESQPQHSLVVNLDQSEEELRSGLSSGHRNAVNGAERRGLKFRTSTEAKDMQEFLRMTRATTKRSGFRSHPDEYYEAVVTALMPSGNAKLFMAEFEGRVVAAAIGYDYEDTRMYAHAASDFEARKLQAAAPLVWMMLMDAKNSGMKSFDLWGVAPEGAGPEHPWSGFTAFKLAFGGERREYLGTWEFALNPVKYKAFTMAKQLRKAIRRR